MSNATLRAGVIGATGRGNYGHGLGDAFAALERTPVVAVADADQAGGAEAASRFGAGNHYLDYRGMLARERLDVVAVSPRWTDQRRDMVVAAAEAGVKGIFCEKPFAATLADADAMMAACDRHGVRVVVAHRRAAAHEMRLKQIVDSGEIGDIQVMRGHGKGDHRAGSLDLMILGTHILDGIRYVAGSEVAWAHGHVTQDGRPVTSDDIKDGDEGVGLLAGNRVAAYYVFENGLTAPLRVVPGLPGRCQRSQPPPRLRGVRHQGHRLDPQLAGRRAVPAPSRPLDSGYRHAGVGAHPHPRVGGAEQRPGEQPDHRAGAARRHRRGARHPRSLDRRRLARPRWR